MLTVNTSEIAFFLTLINQCHKYFYKCGAYNTNIPYTKLLHLTAQTCSESILD